MARHLDPAFRIFLDRLLDVSEELVGDCTVDDPVIERYREVAAGTDRNRILTVLASHDLGALFDYTHSKYRDLRLIDDRSAHERSEYAGIGDRERSVLNFFRRQFLRPRARSEIVQSASDTCQRKVLRVLDHRNDQAPVERNSYANVDRPAVDDV